MRFSLIRRLSLAAAFAIAGVTAVGGLASPAAAEDTYEDYYGVCYQATVWVDSGAPPPQDGTCVVYLDPDLFVVTCWDHRSHTWLWTHGAWAYAFVCFPMDVYPWW